MFAAFVLMCIYCCNSLLVEIFDDSKCLLVGDDTLVSLLNLVDGHQVDTSFGALAEARAHRHFVKQVRVKRDIAEIGFAAL